MSVRNLTKVRYRMLPSKNVYRLCDPCFKARETFVTEVKG